MGLEFLPHLPKEAPIQCVIPLVHKAGEVCFIFASQGKQEENFALQVSVSNRPHEAAGHDLLPL